MNRDNEWFQQQTRTAEQYRRRRELTMTPEDRLVAGEKLRQQAMELLMASPEAYRDYLRRNHRARRDLTDEEVNRRYRQPRDEK